MPRFGLWFLYGLFAVLPAVLLGLQYNVAVGAGYFAMSAVLLSLCEAVAEVRNQLIRSRERCHTERVP